MRSLNPIVLGLALVLLYAAPALATPPTLLIDGRGISSAVPAIGDGVHMLVPLQVFEQLGATVTSDQSAGTAEINWRGVDATVTAGSPIAVVDGARMVMDVAPRVFAGSLEVSLHLLSQAFNVNADYDPGTNTIAIVTSQTRGNFVATIDGPPAGAYSSSLGSAPSLPTVPSTYQMPPTVSDVEPSPESVTGSTYPQIYARFSGGDSSVDPSTVRLEVDGGDVTSLATISSAYIAYTPSAGLANGSHTVTLSGETLDGTSINQTWSFTVDAGTDYDYAASVIGYAPRPWGYRRYGFYPPGFSLYSPGPLWLYGGNVVEVIFFSRYFHNGNGFFTIGGFPGYYPLQPWYGYPGYYWGMVTVPFGVHARTSVLAANFKTADGRTVVVHSTAPMHIDGTRRSAPDDVRYAVLPSVVNRPFSPRDAVSFHQMPIERRLPSMPIDGYAPIEARPVTTMPYRGYFPTGPVFGQPIMRGGRVPMPRPMPMPHPHSRP